MTSKAGGCQQQDGAARYAEQNDSQQHASGGTLQEAQPRRAARLPLESLESQRFRNEVFLISQNI